MQPRIEENDHTSSFSCRYHNSGVAAVDGSFASIAQAEQRYPNRVTNGGQSGLLPMYGHRQRSRGPF
jgi:hypothetical protein